MRTLITLLVILGLGSPAAFVRADDYEQDDDQAVVSPVMNEKPGNKGKDKPLPIKPRPIKSYIKGDGHENEYGSGESDDDSHREDRREDRLKEMSDDSSSKVRKDDDEKHKGWSTQIIKKSYHGLIRLEKLVEKFDARILKMKEKGVDVSVAESQMATVRTNIADAKAKYETLRALKPAEGQIADTAAIETARKSAQEALKKVHESMKAVFETLRSYKIPVTTPVTTTPVVTQ